MPGSESPKASVDAGRIPWGRRWRSRRVVVRDESMAPTLRPGDVLLVDTSAYRRATPLPGEIVVCRDPQEPGRWLIKRVGAVGVGRTVRLLDDDPALPPELPEGTVFLVSDDRRVGRDSRRFGPVAFAGLLGVAWYRVRPRGRSGRL